MSAKQWIGAMAAAMAMSAQAGSGACEQSVGLGMGLAGLEAAAAELKEQSDWIEGALSLAQKERQKAIEEKREADAADWAEKVKIRQEYLDQTRERKSKAEAALTDGQQELERLQKICQSKKGA